MSNRNYTESEKFQLLREVAQLYYPSVGPWTFDTWKDLNQKYFNGELKVGPIEWGLTKHGHALGYYSQQTNKITLHPSLLKPNSTAWECGGLLGEKMAEDVILHEMLHQHLYQQFGPVKNMGHNSPFWCDEVNRLNPLLGIDGKATVTKQRRVKEQGAKGNGKVKWMPSGDGVLTRKQLSSYPHSLRPTGFYEASCREMLERMIKNCNT
jgi:hypothetical protein